MATTLNFTVRGKKRAFLRGYAKYASIERAAHQTGISKSNHYYWLGKDPQYKHDYELAKEVAADVLEDEVVRRAVEGVEEPTGWYKGEPGGHVKRYSDTLLIFMLKGMRPEKYRERYEAKVEHQPTISLEERMARIKAVLERRPDLVQFLGPQTKLALQRDGFKFEDEPKALPVVVAESESGNGVVDKPPNTQISGNSS